MGEKLDVDTREDYTYINKVCRTNTTKTMSLSLTCGKYNSKSLATMRINFSIN